MSCIVQIRTIFTKTALNFSPTKPGGNALELKKMILPEACKTDRRAVSPYRFTLTPKARCVL